MINIGIGVGWAKALYSVANNVIANFKARVLSYPNSIFEAGPCLDATLEELNAIGLLDNASLVITPNAYNEGILYDVIPNTTLGDMDVVRATTATRVNSAGLIEVVPRNLLTYSNDFSNVVWQMFTGPPVTPNSTISPDGLTNGTTLNSAGGVNDFLYQVAATTIGVTYTNSFYIKNLNSTQSQYLGPNGIPIIINWSGPILTSIIGIGSSFVSVGNGWYRVFTTVTAANTTYVYRMYADINNTSKSVYIYGAQLDLGSTATEYFPTTTRLNIPRIDYTNGSCPSLLVEPQRTNLFLRSEEFENVIWTKINSTISANSAISPSGNLNGDSLIDNSTNSIHVCGNDGGGAGVYTFSFYAKANTLNRVGLLTGATVNTTLASTAQVFDLSNGTVVNTISGVTASISALINGWYKCSVTLTALASGTYFITCIKSGTNIAYIGSGERLFIWGAQLEQGSYATSYIPTIASTVTRNADVISKTGISSLIGQTEGTLFCDVNLNSRANFTYFAIAPNIVSTSTYIGIFVTSSIIGFEVIISGVVQSAINFTNSSTGRFKIAAAYKNNDFAFYINGNLIGIDTLGNIPACSELGLNTFSQAQTLNYNSAQLYKTRLTNEQCILLTGDTYNSYAEMATNLNYILQ